MSDENPFRIALLTIILLTVSIGFYFRRKAAAVGEAITYRQEGYLFAATLRSSAAVLFGCVLVYLFDPSLTSWATLPVPRGLRWASFAMAMLGSVLMYWTLASLGKNLTDTVLTRADAVLVTHGPYRWVRHPYYLTTAVLMVSVFLLTANWLIGISSLVVLWLLVVRTPKEEQFLVERFGQQYLDYMKQTGKYFPRFIKTGE